MLNRKYLSHNFLKIKLKLLNYEINILIIIIVNRIIFQIFFLNFLFIYRNYGYNRNEMIYENYNSN
jgi:hypothetical protein